MTERVYSWIRERTGNEVEGEVEVGQGEEGKQKTDELVDKFNVKKDLPPKGMVCLPDLFEVNK